jgi:hypothetical protein
MSTIHRYRSAFLALAALLAVALVAPVAAQVEDQSLAAAPAGPSWDETSGYGSVEASRAAAPEAALGASWDETSGYARVERTRAEVSALVFGELIAGQDPAVALAVTDATLWDETSGYGAVEESRAENSMPTTR